jgi:ferredoxin
MGTPISRTDLIRLKDYRAFLQGRVCTLCGGCDGVCPTGVSYHDYLRSILYRDGYENTALAMETIRRIQVSPAADPCSLCPSCSITCLRGLDVRAEIRKAREMMTG